MPNIRKIFAQPTVRLRLCYHYRDEKDFALYKDTLPRAESLSAAPARPCGGKAHTLPALLCRPQGGRIFAAACRPCGKILRAPALALPSGVNAFSGNKKARFATLCKCKIFSCPPSNILYHTKICDCKFFSLQKAFLPRATRVIYFLFLVLFLYLCLFLSLYLLLS